MKSFKRFYRENLTVEDAEGNTFTHIIDIIRPQPIKDGAKCPSCGAQPCACTNGIHEAKRIPSWNRTGNIVHVYLAWRGKNYQIQMFFPQIKIPSRREVQDQILKVYPGARLWNYQVSDYDPGEPLLQSGGRK